METELVLVEKKASDFTDHTERRSVWSALRKTAPNPLNPCNPWLDSVRVMAFGCKRTHFGSKGSP